MGAGATVCASRLHQPTRATCSWAGPQERRPGWCSFCRPALAESTAGGAHSPWWSTLVVGLSTPTESLCVSPLPRETFIVACPFTAATHRLQPAGRLQVLWLTFMQFKND